MFKELWTLIKPLIGMEEGQTIPKWFVKTGIKRATKLTPNLSKTVLHFKDNRTDSMSAFVKLLTSNDQIGKEFRALFSEALKRLNIKINLLVEEKQKIALELGKQEDFKEDKINKMSSTQTDEAVEDLVDSILANTVEVTEVIDESNST